MQPRPVIMHEFPALVLFWQVIDEPGSATAVVRPVSDSTERSGTEWRVALTLCVRPLCTGVRGGGRIGRSSVISGPDAGGHRASHPLDHGNSHSRPLDHEPRPVELSVRRLRLFDRGSRPTLSRSAACVHVITECADAGRPARRRASAEHADQHKISSRA